MGDKYKCNEEHFGISLIESLNYGWSSYLF